MVKCVFVEPVLAVVPVGGVQVVGITAEVLLLSLVFVMICSPNSNPWILVV
jgi:hypothetical protein